MSLNSPVGATPEGGGFDLTSTGTFVEPARPVHAQSRGRTGTRGERVGIAATLGVPILGLVVCIAGTRTEPLLPQSIALSQSASGMVGPLSYLGFTLTVIEVVVALLLLVGVYLLAMRYVELVPSRLIIWSVALFTVIVVIGPPLFSTDVFSYQAYAKMFAHFHINPYLHGPQTMGYYPLPNELANLIGAKWTATPSVYGPLFTFVSVIFQAGSSPLNYYVFKVMAALSSAGILYLIWRSAERRGVSPKRGVALFGLNPLVTLYGVGGGHNDLLMLLFTTAGVYALLHRHEHRAGALIAAGTAVKLTGAIVAPFALIAERGRLNAPRRRGLVVGAAGVSLVLAAASYVAFGTGILHMLRTLQTVQNEGSWQSLPGFIFSVPRLPVTHGVRLADDVILVGAVLWLLRRVWQGRMDWIDGAALATFAVLATAWSLLPWYSAWMMPLVALSANRRVWQAGTAATLMGAAIMVAGCFPNWNWL
jgi:hypothetical protein